MDPDHLKNFVLAHLVKGKVIRILFTIFSIKLLQESIDIYNDKCLILIFSHGGEICLTVHWKQKWQKKNVPQVWSTPSFKALKMLNLFDLR